jgi:hypothetical protein
MAAPEPHLYRRSYWIADLHATATKNVPIARNGLLPTLRLHSRFNNTSWLQSLELCDCEIGVGNNDDVR